MRFTSAFSRLRCSRFELLGGAEIHRDAVLHHPILFENLIEDRAADGRRRS